MFQTLLVPLDWSDCSRDLVARAGELAAQLGAAVHLLHVIDVPRGLSLDATVTPPGGADRVSVRDWLTADALAQLPPFRLVLDARGVRHTSGVAFGPVVETILATRREVGADLILMGTHARTGLRRALAGSVAEEVQRHADVPVMTFRTRHHAGCEARACDVCTSGRSDAEERLRDELTG